MRSMLITFLSLFGVAACGGGSAESTAPVESFEDALQSRADFVERAGGYGTPSYADWANIPTAGSATYGGSLVGTTSEGALFADLSLSADFANSEISGSIFNFSDEARGRYEGTATVFGDFDRGVAMEDSPLNLWASGTLTQTGQEYLVDLGLIGSFGDGGTLIYGNVYGSVASESVSGEFAASQ